MRKHLFFILGLALTVIFFAVSCTEPEPEVPNASVHVYAAGSYLSDFGPAVLWKNGTVTKLKDCSHPKDIYIHSGDYYIAGYNRVDDMQFIAEYEQIR